MSEQDKITQPVPTSPAVKKVVVCAPEVEIFQSMEELLEQQEIGLKGLRSGEIVSGTVERIDEQGALVNVGAKSEGLVPPDELTKQDFLDISVGDVIDVYVVDNGDRGGNIVLSKKKADYERAWLNIIKAYEENETLIAMVIDRVKGGLVVDLGMRGFLPASHVSTKNVNAMDRFVGQSIKLKVIEVDRHRKRVVVSQKKAVEEERKVRRDVTVSTLEEGQIRRGVVRRVTDYGAFVDLGGIDGLLHVTEMSWSRVNHPSDVVKPGQKIDIMVLKYDPENEKISLGLKQILPDPWQHVDDFYATGDEVEGIVTRLVPFGAFVALDHGIEGIIPNSELADHRIRKPEEVVGVNQRVMVKIINVRPGERRMTLSLRQVASVDENGEVSTYVQQAPSSGMTIGDMLGDVFTEQEDIEEAVIAEPVVVEEEVIVKPVVAEEEAITAEPVAAEEEAIAAEPVAVEEEAITAEPVAAEEEAITAEPVAAAKRRTRRAKAEKEAITAEPVAAEEEAATEETAAEVSKEKE